MIFAKGVAYHFATDNGTIFLEFEPTKSDKLTKVDQSYIQTLISTTGSVIANQNWYYIGNALFKDADMSEIKMISRYNKSKRKWEEEIVDGTFIPLMLFLFNMKVIMK